MPATRKYRSADRQVEAAVRQKEYDSLSIPQKLARIDKRLGKGQGATKERWRLTLKEA